MEVAQLATPEALRPYEERVIPAGRPPEVWLRSTEKSKVETTVTKKPRLGFLRGKTEKQVTWEKRERVIPLERPGEELGRGYARKGDVVATITPGRRPRSGRSVLGLEIPAPAIEQDEGPYLAGALRQLGAEIRAEEAGFYRYGSNWIEHFPFALHEHRLYASPDRLTCLLDFTPGSDQADPPTAAQLLEEAQAQGFEAGELISEEQTALLLSEALTDRASLRARSLSRPLDAEIRIDVSEDSLSARLSLRKGRGEGRPLLLKKAGDAIRARKLKGMDTARVKEDILGFYRGPHLTLEDYLLVEGREAQAGEDGRLEWKVQFLEPERAQRIKEQALARAAQLGELQSLSAFPLASVEAMAEVKERQTVAEVRPATAGLPGVDVFGVARSGIKGTDVPIELFENLQKLRNEVIALSAGLLEKGSRGDTTLLRVRAHRDREVQVSLSEDRMEGFLTLVPSAGTGMPVDPQEVGQLLSQAGVTHGILHEAVAEALRRAQDGEKVERLVVARGREPEHGRDTDLEILVQQASGQRLSVGEDGRADYRRQDRITTVKAETLLARLQAPGTGSDGWDVTGKEVPARRGAARYVHTGKNVECRELEDGSLEYLAKTDGELDCRAGAIEVLQVHTVEGDVGLGSGNVRFPGSIRVQGAVKSGFSVVSDESIFVEESVQGALLSAREAVQVGKGIVGEGRAVLRAGKSIRAHFAEQATLLAVENIHLTNACLRCTVKCNGRMILGSDKGSIIGGRVYCKLGVEAANLGSDREIRTEIHFGQDILVQDQLEREQRNLEKLKVRNREIERALTRTERTTPVDTPTIERLRLEKLRNLQLIQVHSKRVFILQERFEQHFPSEIVVRGVAYPGVVLNSHGRQREVKAGVREVVFYFNTTTGRIEEKALGE